MPRKSLSELGRRERQIMTVVFRRGRASVAEVLSDLPDPPSYSAVRGMLAFLEQKGFLRHEQDGARYVYLPTADPHQVRRTELKQMLRTFFNNSMESAVEALLEVSDQPLSDASAKRLAKLIESARKSGGGK